MSALFEKIDALPIVRMLQLIAVVQFLAGLVMIVPNASQAISFESLKAIGNSISYFSLRFTSAFHGPLILLALAEIIKLMRVKIDDQN